MCTTTKTNKMCKKPNTIVNPKWKPSKNKPYGEVCDNKKAYFIQIPCGECSECKKDKIAQWKMRMYEEIKAEKNAIFVTLTFDEEHLKELRKEAQQLRYDKYEAYIDAPREMTIRGNKANDPKHIEEKIEDENLIAKLAVKRFRERYRKEFKISLRHWFISEKGEEKGRLHLHGIITNLPKDWAEEAKKCSRENKRDTVSKLAKKWHYGHIWTGYKCDEETVGYVMKYVTKPSNKWNYKGQILVSPGLGKQYITPETTKIHHIKIRDKNGIVKYMDDYKQKNGGLIKLCKYWKHKIYSDEERKQMWYDKLNAKIFRYNKTEIKISDETAKNMLLQYIIDKKLKEDTNISEIKLLKWVNKLTDYIDMIIDDNYNILNKNKLPKYSELEKLFENNKENIVLTEEETKILEEEMKNKNFGTKFVEYNEDGEEIYDYEKHKNQNKYYKKPKKNRLDKFRKRMTTLYKTDIKSYEQIIDNMLKKERFKPNNRFI